MIAGALTSCLKSKPNAAASYHYYLKINAANRPLTGAPADDSLLSSPAPAPGNLARLAGRVCNALTGFAQGCLKCYPGSPHTREFPQAGDLEVVLSHGYA
ncbi:hypothetical protein DHEL01_v204229 [Diaporthe helianthi]|uniref:Uncharacterized protein n=1 Tax=Diaporthe helianthi TaxID=158607 RepID=A0A2P5I4D2_DIAHE|nr:hypothetical protein DHEL01_v204229 [Diaporthe helianthi]